MSRNLSDAFEWYIFENTAFGSLPVGKQAVHMGPFATEEECRALLATLNQLPRFNHGNLEVRKKAKRREKRFRVKLPVLVRQATEENFRPAWTVDISRLGARLSDIEPQMKLGEVIDVGYGQRLAVFRVVWVGARGTPAETHTGVECLSPESNIWDLDMSDRCEEDPLRQEIAVARGVQRNLFPRERPQLQTLDYEANCIQARTVGGDYYDFLDMGPGRVGFVLADVAGKGVAAALLMANLHGSIHRHGEDSAPSALTRLLSAVNDHLYRHTEAGRYVTLFFGCYNDEARRLRYVNCGHNPPLLVRQGGAVERLAPTATVLGLFSDWECSVGETRLQAGDVLSLFTDGLTETKGRNGEEFGETRLLAVLQDSRDFAAMTILGNVKHALEQFRSSGQQEDDLTLVIARAH
jgi:hypothetical protein